MVLQNHDTPEFAIPDEKQRVPVNTYPGDMAGIPQSRMFEIKQALKKYKADNPDSEAYDASQGDGGASLPGVPAELLEKANEYQIKHGTGYDKPYGTDWFRQVTAEQYWNLKPESGWGPGNIIFTQGGRDGLEKAYRAMIGLGGGRIGDVLVVSRVPWISYNWGPYGMGLNVLRAPGNPDESWRYTPESVEETAKFARQHGREPAGLVITSPDNPTGRTIPVEEQIELAQAALKSGYHFVLFDWIYHWLTNGKPNDINVVLQAFTPEERDKLMFLDGITKSLGASNIRSAHLLASTDVVKYITSRASHGVIPSFYAQAVAVAAYERGFRQAAAGTIDPTGQSRKVLKQALTDAGLNHIMGDGYYAFIDCTPYIENSKFEDTADLGKWLGENYGVTVVPGVYFSDAGKNWVRFSYALPPERTAKTFERLQEGLSNVS